jgi:hypothetical protein
MNIIRKGANPVKIPFQIKSTDPTLAAWCNEVRTAIRQLESRMPTMPQGKATRQPIHFKVYAVRYDANSEEWKCRVSPGYVRTINPDADATEPVKDWMPTVGSGPAVPLDADTPPEITIADGQTIYCRVATTAKGIIEAAPKIEAAATPEAGTHFQPPDDDVEGDLYFPIADIEITGDPEVVTITQIQQGGPIVVVPNLPELKNIGGEREVFAGRAAAGDTYDLRTLEQLGGETDAKIIKELGETGEGDTIPFRSIKKNNSEGVPYTIDTDDNSVRLTLQGADDSYTDPFGGSILFAGGLVKEFVSSDIEGWWGGLDWYNGGGTEALRLTFEAGVLVGVIKGDSSGGGGYVENPVAGTEATPGFASILV